MRAVLIEHKPKIRKGLNMPRLTQNDTKTSSSELTYQKIFQTSELPLAAFVKCAHKLPLIDAKKLSTGKIVWTFQLGAKDDATIVHEFHTGGMVEASQFYNELKCLRSMTYSL